jgi:hypothetical protein
MVRDIELGNLLFGNSRGEYCFPDRSLVNSKEWESLCDIAQVDEYGEPGFENEVFIIRSYYWGEDDNMANLANFSYKPTGFEIQWYKYPFRDSYMNQNLSSEEILGIFNKCIASIRR